ncbi:MAG TPA: DUF1003 domain-containing protein [Fimbriimonas sp.]|nr:DUF1003 domain-containing protein [Fimbriimonas sp.]
MADETITPSQRQAELWKRLHLKRFVREAPPVKNANVEHQNQLSPLDRLALAITDKVGSMGFFFLIFTWTVCWTGYNIIATKLPGLHWVAFDPFPAFVAYLLISNVIQILLMPLIMVGQNVQSRHSEIRAELDFEINQKAEKEVIAILRGLEHNTKLLVQLMQHMQCTITDSELKAIIDQMETPEQRPPAGGSA